MERKKILVTGCAGFIGFHLSLKIIQSNKNISPVTEVLDLHVLTFCLDANTTNHQLKFEIICNGTTSLLKNLDGRMCPLLWFFCH